MRSGLNCMEGMTKSMAIDLGPHGVRVNTICPTFIETPLARRFLANEAIRTWVLSRIKLGRIGQVEDLMGAVVFLASDASSEMTGSAMVVDGGWLGGRLILSLRIVYTYLVAVVPASIAITSSVIFTSANTRPIVFSSAS